MSSGHNAYYYYYYYYAVGRMHIIKNKVSQFSVF